MTEIH